MDQAWRLKGFEQENAKLKRLVSELSLEKLVLKDIASGDSSAPHDARFALPGLCRPASLVE